MAAVLSTLDDGLSPDRWLITGASGFVGTTLVKRIIDTQLPVTLRLLQRGPFSPSGAQKAKSLLACEQAVGDLLDIDSLEAACADCHTVIHLAGVAHVGQAAAARARNINYNGAVLLLEAAITAGARRFVYLSSSLASAAENPSSEATDYGRDKLAAENAMAAAAKAGRIEVVILRAVNVYGVGMRGNLSTLVRLIGRGRLPWLPKLSMPRLPKLRNRLSLVGVDDLADALIAGASRLLDSDSGCDSDIDNKSKSKGLAADFSPGSPPDPTTDPANQRESELESVALTASAQSATPPQLLHVTVTDGVDYTINEIEDAIIATAGRRGSHFRVPVVVVFAAALTAELLDKLRIFRSGIGLRTYRNLTRDSVFDNANAKKFLGYEPRDNFYQSLPAICAAELGSNEKTD